MALHRVPAYAGCQGIVPAGERRGNWSWEDDVFNMEYMENVEIRRRGEMVCIVAGLGRWIRAQKLDGTGDESDERGEGDPFFGGVLVHGAGGDGEDASEAA